MKLFKLIALLSLVAVNIFAFNFSSKKPKKKQFNLQQTEYIQKKIQGSIIASAIGDAMGKPTEFLSVEQIFTKYPNGIKSFQDFQLQDFWYFQKNCWLPPYIKRVSYSSKYTNKFAPYTDDTQMAKIFLEICIETKNHKLNLNSAMEKLAYKFVAWSKDNDGGLCAERAPGNTCLIACRELENRIKNGINKYQQPWWSCGKGDISHIQTEGGCGSVMRAWPAGLVFYDNIQMAEQLAVAQSALTHRHPKAIAASAAMAVGITLLINDKPVEFVANSMIATAGKYDKTTADLMIWAKEQAKNHTDSTIVFDKLRSWAAHEAIAAALYTLLVSPDDIHKAIYLGVHTPGDSDSIAAMAGALVGARCGISKINKEDIQLLENSELLLNLARQIR